MFFSRMILLFIACFIIYHRPIYSFVIIFLYFAEYFFITIFLLNIYKNYNNYYSLDIKNVDIVNENVIYI